MDKKTKVILKQRWWDDNRAKTLTDKGNLGKALKVFEGAFPLALVAKGVEKVERLNAAEDACKALREAAATTARACVAGVHGDTQWVLKNSFLKAVEEHEKALEKIRDSFKSEINGLDVDGFYKDMSLRTLLVKQCKKEHSMENLEFLVVAGWGGKRDDAAYDMFIAKSASKQVNLPASTFKGLEDAKKAGKLKGSPSWEQAVDDIKKLMQRDTVVRLRKAIIDGSV